MQEGNFSPQQSKGPVRFIEEEWDKKKILITSILLVSLVVGGVAARVYVLEKNKNVQQNPANKVRGVEGANISLDKKETPTPEVPFQQKIRSEVKNQIDNIRGEIVNLDPAEVATSSPQVQKILRDLGALEQYPKSQAHNLCENICKQIQ